MKRKVQMGRPTRI